jgi:hypothetical protein
LKIISKKSNIDQYIRIFRISKRLCLYLFPSVKEQPIVDVESSIMLGDSIFFSSFLFFLFYTSDSLGPQASPHMHAFAFELLKYRRT